MNQEFLTLQTRLNSLNSRKQDIVNYKFMGGGVGLFFFLFISMGFGFIIWMFTAISHNNELTHINVEIASIENRLMHINAEASSKGDEISELKKEIAKLKSQNKK